MKIKCERIVKKEISETVTEEVELVAYWVIRIVRVGIYENKDVIAEIECKNEPTEQEIADSLFLFNNKKVFASVIKNYRLEEKNK